MNTLKELNVKHGDVVQYSDGCKYTVYGDGWLESHETAKLIEYKARWETANGFIIVTSASDEPTLFGDMTPEEKGALLLARRENKVFEAWNGEEWVKGNGWIYDRLAYRIKPDHVIEVHKHVVFAHGESRCTKYKTVDGKVDWESFEVML